MQSERPTKHTNGTKRPSKTKPFFIKQRTEWEPVHHCAIRLIFVLPSLNFFFFEQGFPRYASEGVFKR
jgi:hypothetical protein